MSDKKIRRQAATTVKSVLGYAVARAASLQQSKDEGEDVTSEALALLSVLAMVDRMADIAEGS